MLMRACNIGGFNIGGFRPDDISMGTGGQTTSFIDYSIEAGILLGGNGGNFVRAGPRDDSESPSSRLEGRAAPAEPSAERTRPCGSAPTSDGGVGRHG
jgi:hypothetical protein